MWYVKWNYKGKLKDREFVLTGTEWKDIWSAEHKLAFYGRQAILKQNVI